MINFIKFAVIVVWSINLCGCDKSANLEAIVGSGFDSSKFRYSHQLHDAEIYDFDGNVENIKDLAKKFDFKEINDNVYTYAEISINPPYFVRRKNKGTYNLVLGKLSQKENWSLIVIDY
jgi:hypothetical protein